MKDDPDMHMLNAAFSTDLDAPRVDTLESDYYSSIIHQKYQAFDLELYTTKWFDYRHMTPLQATRVYIDAYGAIYTRIYGKEFDRERAEHVKPITFDKLRIGISKGVTKNKTAFVGCWRGRQVADALCMPYDIYIDLAFTYRLRRWKQGYMPQPQHLIHEYDVEKIQVRWEEMQAGRLYIAEHPAYLVHNYQEIAHQNDYHEWLFKQAKLRSGPAEYLARFIEADQLPIEKVRARIGDHMFEMVERYLN